MHNACTVVKASPLSRSLRYITKFKICAQDRLIMSFLPALCLYHSGNCKYYQLLVRSVFQADGSLQNLFTKSHFLFPKIEVVLAWKVSLAGNWPLQMLLRLRGFGEILAEV